MVGRRFVTVGCCVLLYCSTQLERVHTPNFDAPVGTMTRAKNNTVLPRMAEQPNRSPLEKRFLAASDHKNLSDILRMPLNSPATRFISWSHKIKTFLDMPIIQTNCLTTAVYFEARSEPKMGQLAVAKVILNRVQASNSSICGVVYRGASHFNACQFSFACDGKPDRVGDTRAWQTAVEVATLVIVNDGKIMDWPLEVLATATNYHADYVNPYWSKSFTRLTKIGLHIFYSPSPADGSPGRRKSYI
jgi:hypothetical protein